MTVISLRYHFRQPFRVPAPVVYTWCTDFGPDARSALLRTDPALGPTGQRGRPRDDRRHVPWRGGRVRIRRLVRLFPEERAWTNTHLDGPYEGSQYRYRIVSDRSGGPTSSSMASGSNDIPAPSPRRRPPSGPTGADATTRENGDVVSPRPSSGSARSRSPGNPRRGFSFRRLGRECTAGSRSVSI